MIELVTWVEPWS
jgi:hypothetical protein